MGAVEQALEKAKTKFDHIEDTEKTTNAFFKKTVTCTMQTSLDRRQKDEEEWVVRNRALSVVGGGEMKKRIRQKRRVSP